MGIRRITAAACAAAALVGAHAQAQAQFPVFDLSALTAGAPAPAPLLAPLAPAPGPEVQAANGLPGSFSNDLPDSAVNLGLGATANPAQTTTGPNFFQQLGAEFDGLVLQALSKIITPDDLIVFKEFSDNFWKATILSLNPPGQTNPDKPDTKFVKKLIEAVTAFYKVVQPNGQKKPPKEIIQKIASLSIQTSSTSTTANPVIAIFEKASKDASDLDALVSKLTGIPQSSLGLPGLTNLLQTYLGTNETVTGATASAAATSGS